MGRTDSTATKESILSAAENLFSRKGFDGTGIEEISRMAGVNKALIYYHFKNKEGLLLALYALVLEEVKPLVGKSYSSGEKNNRGEVESSIRNLIRFLKEKQNLLKILLMEAMKGGKSEEIFMDLSRSLMEGEITELKGHGALKKDIYRFLVFEFFTGFLPIYNYVVFSTRWSEKLGQNESETEQYFIDSFIKTHLSYHDFG